MIRLSVDGECSGPAWPETGVDSHWALDEAVIFFAEGGPSTAAGFVNSIALYDTALTEGEMAALGKASADGVKVIIDAVPAARHLPESLQTADSVLVPPEPNSSLPNYDLAPSDGASLVGCKDGSAAWLYRVSGYQSWELTDTFLPPTVLSKNGRYGGKVSMCGDWAVVASYVEDIGGRENIGAVYLYRNQPSVGWNLEQRLEPKDFDGKYFGFRIWLGPDLLAVDRQLTGEGLSGRRTSIYQLKALSGETQRWELATTVDSPDAPAVAINDENSLFITDGRGRISFLKDAGDHWQTTQFRLRKKGVDREAFGTQMATDGEVMLAGWTKAQSHASGQVYIFRKSEVESGGWIETGSILAPFSNPVRYYLRRKWRLGRPAVVSSMSEDPEDGVAIPISAPGRRRRNVARIG
ncbi:MAG: hypothetical protein R3F19_17775 [Verrucomicrobiales bacterium]